jgi:hypothetical protein
VSFRSKLHTLILSTQYVRVWTEGTHGNIVRLCRTPLRIDTLDDAKQVFSGVVRALHGLDRKTLGFAIDFREARGRNDLEFERTVAPYRAELTKGFHRVAVLTKSLTGQMQVQRLAREDGVETVRCFDNEAAALDWLEQALQSRPLSAVHVPRLSVSVGR